MTHFADRQTFIHILFIIRYMSVRIRRRSLLAPPVLAFLVILMSVVITIIYLENYRSLFLTFILYAEFVSLLILMAYILSGRSNDSDSGVKYSFNSEGILVNRHLVYPWAEVESVLFRKYTNRFRVTQLSSGNSRFALRELGNVPSRNGSLIPVYRTYSYGTIEVYSNMGSKPSVIIKCPPYFLTARRMFRKMGKYSVKLNPNINFHIQTQ